ncbi:MAG: hypothetical protein CL681_22375 [Blastopirellula sp.]|nr:hypothetical protein [Blastopirellula sp.]
MSKRKPRSFPVKATVFYDGECGLCDRTVRFLIAKDQGHQLTFSPLQSHYAQNVLPSSLTKDLTSYVVFHNSQIMTKGTAIKFLIKNIENLRFYSWILPIPLIIVNLVYSLVGAYRYKLFRKPEICAIAEPALLSRFIE